MEQRISDSCFVLAVRCFINSVLLAFQNDADFLAIFAFEELIDPGFKSRAQIIDGYRSSIAKQFVIQLPNARRHPHQAGERLAQCGDKSELSGSGSVFAVTKSVTACRSAAGKRSRLCLVIGSSRLASSADVQLTSMPSSILSICASRLAPLIVLDCCGRKPQCGQTGECVEIALDQRKAAFDLAKMVLEIGQLDRGISSMPTSFCSVCKRGSARSAPLRLSSFTPKRARVCRSI